MEMPQVKACGAAKCSYNKAGACHALAVTIGEAGQPVCDTFLANGASKADVMEIAGVGACKVEDCEHNQGLYCTAASIQVKHEGGVPVCATYAAVKEHAVK